MYHLLLDRKNSEGVKFVSDSNRPMYATVDGKPLFFSWDKEFRLATDYTIMYPKVYVKESEPYTDRKKLISRSFLH